VTASTRRRKCPLETYGGHAWPWRGAMGPTWRRPTPRGAPGRPQSDRKRPRGGYFPLYTNCVRATNNFRAGLRASYDKIGPILVIESVGVDARATSTKRDLRCGSEMQAKGRQIRRRSSPAGGSESLYSWLTRIY